MKTTALTKMLALFCLIAFAGAAKSQEVTFNNSKNYHTAIGLRAGGTSGLTIKQFMGQSSAIEGIIGVWGRGFSGTVLYEKYAPTGAAGLSWYFGGGGHAAFYSGHRLHYWNDRRYEYYTSDAFGLGVDGIVGIEYKIPPIPVAISLDVKPFIEFVSNGTAWMAIDPGLGVKFTF